MVIDYEIKADDQNITQKIKAALVSLTLTDTAGDQADGLNLVLADPDHSLSLPTKSTKLDVAIGYQNDLHRFGHFFVDTISFSSPPSVLHIGANSVPFAKSDHYQSMEHQHSRSFGNLSLKSLLEKIAKEHGMTVSIGDKLGAIKIKHINQTAESNIGFLFRVVRQYGGILKPTYSKLVVIEKEGRNAHDVKMATIKIDLSETTQHSYQTKYDASYQSVSANYHDVKTGKTQKVTIGQGQPEFILSYLYENKAMATSHAQKVKKSMHNSSDTLNINMCGNPKIIAGCNIKLAGFKQGIPEEWAVKTVTHTISDQGYTSNMQLIQG